MDPFPRLGTALRLAGSTWGSFILTVDRTGSTNDLALEYARNHDAPHGSLFLAAEQSAGRGRFRRAWASAPGGLFLSVVLRPETERKLHLLPLLVSVAAAEAIRTLTDQSVRLRWPNDLFIRDRKLGGVLCEGGFKGNDPDVFVVGIGINVSQARTDFPSDLRERAALLDVAGLTTTDVAAAVVTRLERWWEELERGSVIARYREMADGLGGERVRVEPRDAPSFTAVTAGISEDGGLVVEPDDGGRRVLFAETMTRLKPAAAPDAPYSDGPRESGESDG